MSSPIIYINYSGQLVSTFHVSNIPFRAFPEKSDIPLVYKAKLSPSRIDHIYNPAITDYPLSAKLKPNNYLNSELLKLWESNAYIETITNDQKTTNGYTFVRIKAKKNFTCHGKEIEKGTVGGYIAAVGSIKDVDPIWVEDGSYFYAFASGEILVESNSFVVIENLVCGRIRFTNTRIVASRSSNIQVSVFYDVWLANSRIETANLTSIPIKNQKPVFYRSANGSLAEHGNFAELVIVGESNKRKTCILDSYFEDSTIPIPSSLAHPYILTTGLKHTLIYDLFIKKRKIKKLYFHNKFYTPFTQGSSYWTPETS